MRTQIFAAILTLGLAACATTSGPAKGVVLMKTSPDEAHVRLKREPAILVGEKLNVSREVCKESYVPGARGARRVRKCQMQAIGSGEVVRTYNEKDLVVRFSPGVNAEEGDQVERASARSTSSPEKTP